MPLPELPLNAKLLTIPMVLASVIILADALFPYGELRQTYDSRDLIAASQSVQTYLHGKNPEGYSYLVRAPFHPFILSFFSNKVEALWWMNCLCLVGSLALIFYLCRALGFSESISSFLVLLTVTFYPWLMNFQFFWTEQIFIFLILCLCISLLKDQHTAVVIAWCTLLFLIRKPGIFFFISAAAFYGVDRKFTKGFLVFLSSLVVFALWQGLEYALGSTGYFGYMLDTLDEFYRIYYLEAATSWFLPMLFPLAIRVAVMVALFGISMFYFRREIFSFFRERQNLVLLMVPGVYTAMFILFTGASGYEDAERYLNVVFPLWAILLAGIFHKIWHEHSGPVRASLLLPVCLWFLYSFSRTVHHLF